MCKVSTLSSLFSLAVTITMTITMMIMIMVIILTQLSFVDNTSTSHCSTIIGHERQRAQQDMKGGSLLLLENLRLHSGENLNDPSFAMSLTEGVGTSKIHSLTLRRLYILSAFL